MVPNVSLLCKMHAFTMEVIARRNGRHSAAQSGDLTAVQTVTTPGIGKPAASTPMAISPDKKFLFAATRGEPQVAASFRIDQASGKPTTVSSGHPDGRM